MFPVAPPMMKVDIVMCGDEWYGLTEGESVSK